MRATRPVRLSKTMPPTVLAYAPADEVMETLRRLGFLHRNARVQQAAEACRFGVPKSATALMEIPGVGSYAAAATLCFAFGQRRAIVDPSVIRVLGRLRGI